ncbi:hypothetical protein ASPTUDRAFT_65061 [Aspergillus tubingensis CBS 134.48]|uniref:Uncharacterized protein n=1 Tax=Aspergillus tubingensis (strain CBS 134.48) TaxID=767770 RepID=A0A1L9N721_ASPTC|nr:hypothetical protein ASPTUDRAFT_65061 [Aspergillus tubingensis CBS 134.48]
MNSFSERKFAFSSARFILHGGSLCTGDSLSIAAYFASIYIYLNKIPQLNMFYKDFGPERSFNRVIYK